MNVNRLLLKRFRITKIKILVASILYKLIGPFIKNHRIAKRGGLAFELDLNEGIDFHLFLFGNFQKNVIENKVIHIPEDGVILDVGANIGVMTLFFAQKVKNGFVHSFEPTNYAFNKFTRNLELNPQLKERVKITKTFISSEEGEENLVAYSSWPIDGKGDKHRIHGGVAMAAENTPTTTLDQYCLDNNLSKVTLVKIDTDGHEFEVLKGMQNLLTKVRPQIIFEIGKYIMKERKISFQDYIEFFKKHNYAILTTKGYRIGIDNYDDYIPEFGTIDLAAIPDSELH